MGSLVNIHTIYNRKLTEIISQKRCVTITRYLKKENTPQINNDDVKQCALANRNAAHENNARSC